MQSFAFNVFNFNLFQLYRKGTRLEPVFSINPPLSPNGSNVHPLVRHQEWQIA